MDRLKVVYSREEARKPAAFAPQDSDGGAFPASGTAVPPAGEAGASGTGRETSAPVRRAVPGSVMFVPAAAGLILAGEVVKDLCGIK